MTTPLAFAVQKHDASRLHYDFRIEWDGVLKSWAVARGPSLDPSERRLAVRVGDHALGYADFEGTIPKGEYGAGTVMLWDRGSWVPECDVEAGLREGHLRLQLLGQKMRGGWSLIRMAERRGSAPRENWLLVKRRDREASTARDLLAEDRSVRSGRLLHEIADGSGADARPRTGQPLIRAATSFKALMMPSGG